MDDCGAHEPTEKHGTDQPGIDRRQLIRRAAAAGVLAWAAPVIIESLASPATAASGTNLIFGAVGPAKTYTTNASQTVTYPSGVATNDQLFLVIVNNNESGPPCSNPAGWTQIGDPKTSMSASGMHARFFGKLAAGETSVSFTSSNVVAGTGAAAWVVQYYRPSGYPPNPSENTSGGADTAVLSGNSITPTSAKTNAANSTVICFVLNRGGNVVSLSTPQGFTLQDQDTATVGVNTTLGVADKFVATSGTTQTSPTWADSGTVTAWLGRSYSFA